MNKVINTKVLAEILGSTPGTINTLRWLMKNDPKLANKLPPALDIPGRPRWSIDVVNDWLAERSGQAPAVPATTKANRSGSRPAGRPRKTELPKVQLL